MHLNGSSPIFGNAINLSTFTVSSLVDVMKLAELPCLTHSVHYCFLFYYLQRSLLSCHYHQYSNGLQLYEHCVVNNIGTVIGSINVVSLQISRSPATGMSNMDKYFIVRQYSMKFLTCKTKLHITNSL